MLSVGACGGSSAGSSALQPTPSDSASTDRVTQTIFINQQTTFAPPPSGVVPKLDAEQAWRASFLGRGGRSIPGDVSYELGLLTVPPSVTDVLAWGYHGSPAGCLTTGGALRPSGADSPTPTPTPTPTEQPQCVMWTFIDATDASNPGGTQQVISGPGANVPTPTPPAGTTALESGGGLDAQMERFSPDALVVQAPLSTIRWTFDMASCSIDMHWFQPPDDVSGQTGEQPCRDGGRFSVDTTAGFTTRGKVFAAISGHVDDRTTLVRLTLANGDTQWFDADDTNRAWTFAVQRCGDFAGTLPVTVEEISYPQKSVIARLPIDSARFNQPPDDCAS
jgi:hypothetical protein